MASKKITTFLEEQMVSMYTGKAKFVDDQGVESLVDVPEDEQLSANQKSVIEQWVSNVQDFEKCSIVVHIMANGTRRLEMFSSKNEIVSWIEDLEYNEPIIEKMAIVDKERVDDDMKSRNEVSQIKKKRVQEAQKKAIEEENVKNEVEEVVGEEL